MVLPLITAGVSLGAGIAVVGLLSHVINIATFSNELALLIGLGVGVDYALFIVTRYQQALQPRRSAGGRGGRGDRHLRARGAVRRADRLHRDAGHVRPRASASSTASRSRRAVTVAFTVVAALTLLPALLGILGRLVPRRRERRAIEGGQAHSPGASRRAWVRWADAMSRRPAVVRRRWRRW